MLNKKIFLSLMFAVFGFAMPMFAGESPDDMAGYDWLCSQVTPQMRLRHTVFEFELWNESLEEEIGQVVAARLMGEPCLVYQLYPNVKDIHGYTDYIAYLSKMLADGRSSLTTAIAALIKDGANINAQDENGKTVLSYCKSKEMYNALRENGAKFQFDVWMRIYQTELAIASIFATATAVYLNQK